MAGFSLLCARLVFLQVIEAEEISTEVRSARTRLERIEARRGNITDRNGNLLAGTRSRIDLGIDPQAAKLEDREKIALLAAMIDRPLDEVLAAIGRRTRIDSEGKVREVRWVKLAEVDEEIFEKALGLEITGLYGNRRYERFYPGREMGAHLIGYLNKEETPVMGVERALDFYLRGQSGWIETEVDGRRRELAAFREREVDPRNGLDVQLTIDLFVQSIIENAIKNLVETANPAGVSIIVSRPDTGEILGLANYPTFDPNTFWEFPIENQRNRALSDQYEPGSTYKIVPVAAALEEGIVGPDSLIDCRIERKLYNGVNIPMPQDHRNMGIVPVRTVIAKSSNRGAAQIGMLLGEQLLYEWSARFGFGKPVEWPLGGASAGSLMEVPDWDGYTISRLPTGYAIGATPMQIHMAMATIANGGVRAQPRILKKVVHPEGRGDIELGPEKRERILSERTARTLTGMLLEVVSPEGTATRAELPGYAVAGKTGTARKIIDGSYSLSNHVGSFSGFFPANNPEVVITVVVDDAHLSGPAYGGVVAAPVFREIGAKLIPHLAIRKPDEWDPFIVSK